jgi:DNA-binding CsgD family transcriptional regulator
MFTRDAKSCQGSRNLSQTVRLTDPVSTERVSGEDATALAEIEISVLDHLRQGRRHAEIIANLGIGRGDLVRHIAAALAKVNAEDRGALQKILANLV